MYCTGKDKAIISVLEEKLIFPAPINITMIPAQNKIIRVQNQGLCNDAWYEGFFCGDRVEFFGGSNICGNPSQGFNVYDKNNSLVFSTGEPTAFTGGRAGTFNWNIVNTVIFTPGFQSTNSAQNCTNKCTFSVTNENGIIYLSKEYAECPKYTVSCDEDCPQGLTKIETDIYPGFCCLDCKILASEVRNIRGLIK